MVEKTRALSPRSPPRSPPQGTVTDWCPTGIGKLHGGLFDPTGVPTYPVKKQGSNLMVQVDVNAKFAFEAQYWSGALDAQGKANGKYY